MNRLTAIVDAYIVIDIENLVQEIVRDYNYTNMSEISRDDIFEYISDHTTYMSGKNSSAIFRVSDGNNIASIDSDIVNKIMAYITESQ